MEIRNLRDLTRYRKKLLQDTTQEKNRIHKVLQDANIKITTYISDIFGVSGRNILECLHTGEVITADKISRMVKGKVRSKVPGLVDALNNRLHSHHREMIRFSWKHLEYLERTILDVEARIDQCLYPYQKDMELLDSIPGVAPTAAAVMIAELGTDMSVFRTDRHVSCIPENS